MSDIPELRTSTEGTSVGMNETGIEFKKHMVDTYNTKFEYPIYDPITYEHKDVREIHIVHPSNRRTSEIMSMYEYTAVISIRAGQIQRGAPIFAIKIGNEISPIRIAEIEIYQKKCPLSIRRMYDLGATYGEIWKVNEMVVPYVSSHW